MTDALPPAPVVPIAVDAEPAGIVTATPPKPTTDSRRPSANPSPGRWRGWLRAFAPTRGLPSAVFEREVRAQGRRVGTYVARGLYAFLLTGLFALMFGAFMVDMDRRSGATALQQLQSIAPGLTVAVLWFEFVGLGLLAPLLVGGSICDERRTGTLATLLTTPLTAGQIILGKLLGALVQVLVLASIASPVLLLIRVFGGVDVKTIFAGLGVTLSFALLAASLAISASVRATRGTFAALTGMLGAIMAHTVPFMALGIASIPVVALVPPGAVLKWGFPTCAPAVLGILSGDLAGGGAAPPGMPWSLTSVCVTNSLYSLVLAALALAWATARLRRVMVAVGAGTQAIAPRKKPKKVRRAAVAAGSERALGPSTQDAERLGRERGEVGDRPVLWREWRQSAFRRTRDPWVIAAALAGLMVWLFIKIGPDEKGMYLVPTVIGFLLLVLQAMVISTGVVTGEREGRTWETLLSTPMRPWDILAGKAIGSCRKLWYIPTLLLALFVFVAVPMGMVNLTFFLHAAIIFTAPTIALVCTGVLSSLVFRRTVHAAAANMGLALTFWLGIPLVLEIMRTGHADDFFGVTNPLSYLIAMLDRNIGEGSRWSQGYRPAQPFPDYRIEGVGHPSWIEFTLAAMGMWVGYVGVGVAALVVGAKIFNSRCGRTS